MYTTVNVQHLEGMNERVAAATSVAVAERVPDRLFDAADSVELVDIEPAELIERLRAGKVYAPERAAWALEHFFSRANLGALREIALRRAARSPGPRPSPHLRAPGGWRGRRAGAAHRRRSPGPRGAHGRRAGRCGGGSAGDAGGGAGGRWREVRCGQFSGARGVGAGGTAGGASGYPGGDRSRCSRRLCTPHRRAFAISLCPLHGRGRG